MFDVLVFVYENYDTGEACPEAAHLERKLNAVGFEREEIADALQWLDGLSTTAERAAPQPWLREPHDTSVRIYTAAEQSHLGVSAMGFISFMESARVLPAYLREVIIDRAMAAPGGPISLDDLKVIILLVYWSFGEEPDALVLDELCDDSTQRVAH